MGRIRQPIRVDGREFWTLFDTGARNTYVVPAVAEHLLTLRLTQPIRATVGGEAREATAAAILHGEVDGHRVNTHAFVIDEIGRDEGGNRFEILFGALAMRQWGIQPVPDEERLDFTHYPHVFVEFSQAPCCGVVAGMGALAKSIDKQGCLSLRPTAKVTGL